MDDLDAQREELQKALFKSVTDVFASLKASQLPQHALINVLDDVISTSGNGISPAVKMLIKQIVVGEETLNKYTLIDSVLAGLESELVDSSDASRTKFNDSLNAVIGKFQSIAREGFSTRSQKSNVDQDAEADSAPLGRYAFAGARVPSASVPFEEDTDVEAELLNALIDHFALSRPMSEENAELLRSLLKRKMYSDIIKPPDSKFLYRGVRSTVEFIERLTGMSGLDVVDRLIDEKQTFIEFDASNVKPWRAKDGSSFSWTSDVGVAKDFAHGPGTKELWPIVAVAKSSENEGTFLSGRDGLYKIAAIGRTFSGESEAVALGPVKLSKIYVYMPSTALIDKMDTDARAKSTASKAVEGLHRASASLRESSGDPVYCVRGGENVLIRRKSSSTKSWQPHTLKKVTYFKPEELVRAPDRSQFGRNWTFERDSWLVSVRDEQFLYVPDAQ